MSFPRHHRAGPGGRAFTIVEMMVSVAVLCLLVLMLTQMVGLSRQAIVSSMGRLDSVEEARLVFDRIGADLAARPHRPDLGMSFAKADGNDSFLFYSGMAGYSGTRHMSLIGYRIQEGLPGRLFQLERGAAGVDWTGSPLVFLPNKPAAPADENYEVLAKGVFRLEFCYLLNTPPAAGSAIQLSNSASADYSNVAAVVVALAVLDDTSLRILNAGQIKQLSTALADSVEGQYPITGWSAALSQGGFAAGIPRQVVQGGLHVYQRTFNVP